MPIACPTLVSLLGASKDEARAVLDALGWREVAVAGAKPVWRRAKEKSAIRRKPKTQKPEPPPDRIRLSQALR